MIKKEAYIPPKKVSRSEIVNAIRALKPGESILITGESLTDRTQNQVYTAASRERIAIRTQKSAIGLRVWLKEGEPGAVEKEEVLAELLSNNRPDHYPPLEGPDHRTAEQKRQYLAEYFGGTIEVEPREAMKEIDKAAQEELDRSQDWGA